MRKLYDVLGTHGAVGKADGCTDAVVSYAFRDNTVSSCYELAAMGVWLRDFEPKPEAVVVNEAEPYLMNDGDVFVSMRIDKGAWHAIKGWLKEAAVPDSVTGNTEDFGVIAIDKAI